MKIWKEDQTLEYKNTPSIYKADFNISLRKKIPSN